MGGSKLTVGETQRLVGGISPLDWEEVNSILDETTGLTYCMILVPVIVLYLCRTLVSTLKGIEFHLQGVAPKSQYSDLAPEVVTLQ